MADHSLPFKIVFYALLTSAVYIFCCVGYGRINEYVATSLGKLENLDPMISIDETARQFFKSITVNFSVCQFGLLFAIIIRSKKLRGYAKMYGYVWLMVFFYKTYYKSEIVSNHLLDGRQDKVIKKALFFYEFSDRSSFTDKMDELQDSFQCCGLNGFLDYNQYSRFQCLKDGSLNCSLPASCFKKEVHEYIRIEQGENTHSIAIWEDAKMKKVSDYIHVRGCGKVLEENFKEAGGKFFICSLLAMLLVVILFGVEEKLHNLLILDEVAFYDYGFFP